MQRVIRRGGVIVMIMAVIAALAGCTSESVITINSDGSFDVSAHIVETVGDNFDDSSADQLRAMLEEKFEGTGVEYSEYHEGNQMGYDVSRHFASYGEFVNPDNWAGLSFVPVFTDVDAKNAIKITKEDGKYVISGHLDGEVANGLMDSVSSSGAVNSTIKMTIVTPVSASENDATSVSGNSYTWETTLDESIPVNLVIDSASGGASWIWIVICALVIVAAAAFVLLKKKPRGEGGVKTEAAPASQDAAATDEKTEQ